MELLCTTNLPMTQESSLIYSPLQQTVQENGRSAEIHIYRSLDSLWILEVVDDRNNSTVWEQEFESDQQALETALREIRAVGLAAFCDQPADDGPASGRTAVFDSGNLPESDLPPGLQALNEAELDELENFLLYEVDADESMTFEMLDGFLHALAIGPVTVLPQQWLPKVWGLDRDMMPPMESIEQVNRVLGLLMRHYNSIIARLQLHPPMVLPLWSVRLVDEQEVDEAEGWAYGFTEGVKLSRSAWRTLLESEQGRQWYRPIGLLGEDDFGPEQDELTTTIAQRHDLAQQIPDAVLALHAYWLPMRHAMHERAVARQLGGKVGRNEPCPCGSGKKFKKCCGSAAELH